MECTDFFDLLDKYESLTENEKTELDIHASECEICCYEYEFFKSITAAVSTLPCPEPPKDLISKVNGQIDMLPTGRFNGFMNNIKHNSYKYASVAACLAVGLAVGLNSKTINKRLTDNSNDGVISTTKVTETVTESPERIAEEVVKETETIAIPTELPEKKAVPAEIKKVNTASERNNTVTAVPKKKSDVKQSPVPVVKEETKTPTAEKTEEEVKVIPEIVTAEPTETADNEKDSKGTYTIARGVYYIPEATEQPVAVVAEELENVEDYSLATGNCQIAIGYYDIPENSVKKSRTSEFKEQLIVSVNDVVEITAHMMKLGVMNSGKGYQMQMADFYELLSILDAEGISYRYSSGVTSGDTITFSIVTY